jgi:hypothetical protein
VAAPVTKATGRDEEDIENSVGIEEGSRNQTDR